ncbi:MAG: aminoacyl-tRNA hydrolase [Patescibacteria group bacterium]
MKLIVGLGNPGKEYEGTRHNVGFRILDALADNPFKHEAKFKAEVSEWRLGSEKVLLAKPTTFMNLSGDAVQALKSFYKLENQDILVIQDEMDHPTGIFAFSINAGPAGHKGIDSIQERLGTKEFARLRIGIGRPSVGTKEDFVLTRFSKEEEANISSREADLAQAIKDWIKKGLTKTMNVWNGV